MVKLTKDLIKSLNKNTLAVLKTLDQDSIANIIQQANYRYHTDVTPLFSDNIYDVIREYLEELNPKHPILKNIGSFISDDNKVELPYFMGSLDKIKTDQKLIDKFKATYKDSYIISDKLDGISGLICFKNNKVSMYSRGDGTVGQDITHLIPFIKNIPELSAKKELAIRGEFICSKADFAEHFSAKTANGRNMVGGLINSKIPDLQVAAYTQFVAYELIHPKLKPEDQMKEIKNLGFKCVYYETLKDLDLTELSSILVKRREISEFEVDGVVLAHNQLHNRTRENPKYAFAFKSVHTMDKAEVLVASVEWNISKDGYLIPVVIFNGIKLAGVTIKRATGFNGKYILDNKIGPGAKIEIIRSGDVIPYISKIITPAESAAMPEQEYTWSKTGVDIILVDKEDSTIKFKNIEYFFNKIDITGLSTGNLKKMYDVGYDSIKKIINMKQADYLKVDGFKEKTSQKLYTGIQEKIQNIDCVLLMDASNIFGRGIGSKKIKLITDLYPQIISHDYIPTIPELVAIKGVEDKTAKLFADHLPEFHKFKKETGLTCGEPKAKAMRAQDQATPLPPQAAALKDITVVFTGFRSKILEEFIVASGGKVGTSISKNTGLVIRKDHEESSKVDKANELGIKLVNLSDFEKEYNIKAK